MVVLDLLQIYINDKNDQKLWSQRYLCVMIDDFFSFGNGERELALSWVAEMLLRLHLL